MKRISVFPFCGWRTDVGFWALLMLCQFFLPLPPVGNLFAQETLKQGKQQQEWEFQQYRLARSYQMSNQHRRAAAILEKLYSRRPGDVRYYGSLLQSYLELNWLDKALELVGKQQLLAPHNPRYEIDYANILFRKGQQEEAKKIWNRILEQYPDNILVINQVANLMLENGLFDQALETLKWAYRKNPDKEYLLQNIARLYRTSFRYQEALQYYLLYLQHKPEHFNTVLQQVLSLPLDSAQADTALSWLEEQTRAHPQRDDFRLLLGQMYQKYGYFQKAQAVYHDLTLASKQPEYLLKFAQDAQNDSLFEIALKAYQTVINQFPDSPYLPQAYLGYAQCSLELAERYRDANYARQAVETLAAAEKKFRGKGARRMAQLELLLGKMYKNYFFDLDRAIEIFQRLVQNPAAPAGIREEAHFQLAEAYLMRGELEPALSALRELEPGTKRFAERSFAMAQVYFFAGEMDSARAMLEKALSITDYENEIINDVLELQTLINVGVSSREALVAFARARWLQLQQKKNEALNRLQEALEHEPVPLLKMRILMLAGQLARELNKPLEAMSYYQQILDDEQLYLYADQALFHMAQLAENQLNEGQLAYQLYDRILMEFPNSEFVPLARSHLRALRKKYPEIVP